MGIERQRSGLPRADYVGKPACLTNLFQKSVWTKLQSAKVLWKTAVVVPGFFWISHKHLPRKWGPVFRTGLPWF